MNKLPPKVTSFFLIGFFIVAIISFVNPIGDFPLNDDWQYAYPVKNLVEKGYYDLIGQFSPNIFLQVIWGYLFCIIPNDFSFTYLRISTLVTAIFCGIIFYQVIKNQKGRNRKEAFLLTLFLIFNPLFFSLSFSFMTDVPFLTLCLSSLFFYKSYLQQEDFKLRMLGAMFAIAAFFIRQPGILIWLTAEFSIVVFYLIKEKKRNTPYFKILKGKTFTFFTGSVLSVFLIYFFVEKGLKPSLGVSEHYVSVGAEYLDTFINNPLLFVFQFSKRSLMTVFYIGLFFLPFIVLIFEKIKYYQLHQKWILAGVVGFNLLTTYFLYRTGYIFPYGGNIIYNLGLGPNLLTDALYYDLPTGFELSKGLMLVFGMICQVLGSYIFIIILKKIYHAIQQPLQHKFFLTLIFTNVIYLSAMIVFSYFDRYLLLFFASLLIILFGETSLKKLYQYKSFLLLTILMCWFSFAATKDYLSWNRTSLIAFEYLKKQGVQSELIDAGLPKNGFEQTIDNIGKTHQYVLSFNEIEHYELIQAFPFYRWLNFQKDEVYILKRKPNIPAENFNRKL